MWMLLVLVHISYGIALQLTKQNGDLDTAKLAVELANMQESISLLQTEGVVHAKKNADVMSTVLAKLTQTTDEIALVKSQLQGSLLKLTDIENRVNVFEKNYTETISAMMGQKSTDETTGTSLDAALSGINVLNSSVNAATDDMAKMSEVQLQINSSVNQLQADLMAMKVDVQKANVNVANVTSSVSNVPATNLSIGNISSMSSNDTKALLTKVSALASTLNRLSQSQDAIDLSIIGTQDSIRQVTEDVARLSSTVSIVKANQVNKIAFNTDVQVKTQASQEGVVTFDSVRLNVGGGYNNDTGVFTVPKSGAYMFWVKLVVKGPLAPGQHVTIVKGEHDIAKGLAPDQKDGNGNTDVTVSASVVVHTFKGEIVSCVTNVKGELRKLSTSFGGFMI